MIELNFTEMDKAYDAIKNKIAEAHGFQMGDMAVIESSAIGFFQRMKQIQADIDAAAKDLERQGDETYDRLYKAINAIIDRIDQLLKANNRPYAWVLPVDIKALIDTANLLGQMNELQFGRLAELARAFGKDEQHG